MCRALTLRKHDAPSRTRTRESDRRQVSARSKGGTGFFLTKQANQAHEYVAGRAGDDDSTHRGLVTLPSTHVGIRGCV